MEEPLSYLSLAPHVKSMRILGIYRLDTKSSKIFRNIHNVYMRVIIALVVIYTIQQVLKVYEVREDAHKVMGTMFLFLTNTDFIYKAVVLWKRADKIEGILDIMKGPLFNQNEPEHRPLLLQTVREALIVVRTFNYMSLFTCLLWILHPTIQHIQGKVIELPIWLPFDYNSNPQMADKIQDIFGDAIFYQFLVAGWILCTSAYRMINVNSASMEFVSMIMYIICILIEIFLYCFYGNEITYESEMLTAAVYDMNWLFLSGKHRRTLIIFMERIKRSIRPVAGFILPLSNSTFVSVVRSSYSFYAFLKNSDKEET
ncbi:uncharacterized protein ACR2FA_011989 [Aphomia sociella]